MPIPWKTLEIYRDLTSKVFKCNIRTNWIFQRSIKDVWRQIWYNIVGSHKYKYRLKVFWPGFNFGLQVSPSSKAAQRWQVTKTIAERQRGFQERDPQTPTGHWPPNHHMPTPNSMFPKVLSSWWYCQTCPSIHQRWTLEKLFSSGKIWNEIDHYWVSNLSLPSLWCNMYLEFWLIFKKLFLPN